MTSFSLNLPNKLKEQAERYAATQGISLEKFVLLALAEKLEKIATISQPQDDINFPHINYRRGASGIMQPVIKGTNLRVQTLVIASQDWGLSVAEIADDYELSEKIVQEALDFYQTHQQEVNELINSEAALELIDQ